MKTLWPRHGIYTHLSYHIDFEIALIIILFSEGSKSNGQTMPEEIDGETDPDMILDKFREVYETLYNSSDTSDAMEVIKEKLETVIGQNSLEEVNEITSTIVKQACAKMKPGKMDVSGGYTSDCLLHANGNGFEFKDFAFRCLGLGTGV